MENLSTEDQETIREFLVESYENLSRLDQDMVELERHPGNRDLLGSIFRTIHTIKGACGFLSFTVLEGMTHQAESLLSQLRDGKRALSPAVVSLILETADATRKIMAQIEVSGTEGTLSFEDLTARLRAAGQSTPTPAAAQPADPHEDLTGNHGDEKSGSNEADEESEMLRSPAAVDSNIRVGVGLLDTLMDLVGELVLTRNQILQFNQEREDPALNTSSQRLNLITTELQESILKMRMQPIGVVWNKLPRVVRDMALALGKQIELVMDGAETELDRTIIEAIKDPLMHLVRNSCDHGIESTEVRASAGKTIPATLTLRAYHEGGQVNIEVGDDGAGINVARVKQKAVENGMLRLEQADKLSDREAFNLIFQPGFSTAKTVTHLSGRGVGMDVVKSHIEKIGGLVDLTSRPGEGSTVKIRIPLTLAILPGLVIVSGGERFVIPQVSLLELIRLDGDATGKRLEYVHGTPVYRRHGNLLPVAYLNEVLDLQPARDPNAMHMVVLQAEDRQFGLVVDSIHDSQEIVVKPLGKQLKGLTLYAGATIMGDGRVALILDILGIGQRSGILTGMPEQAPVNGPARPRNLLEQQRFLLLQAGSYSRLAVPLALVARLEEFPRAAIEHAGGAQVVQYRDRILPLVSLRSVLEPEATDDSCNADPVQVVVFHDGDHSVGMVVDKILDVAEEAVTARQQSDRKGLLGSAVVGDRVTDFLDLRQVIQAIGSDWSRGLQQAAHSRKLLVADGSVFSRGTVRGGLEMAGYVVLEAANVPEAVRALEHYQVDGIVAAVDLPGGGGPALLAALRDRPAWVHIPLVAIARSPEIAQSEATRAAGFSECLGASDHEAILASVALLLSSTGSAATVPIAV